MKKLAILLLGFFFLLQSTQLVGSSDLSVLLAESQMKRESPMTRWTYYYGFYMYALYDIYERTQNPEYFEFIKEWADESLKRFDQQGKVFDTLDDMYPGLVLLYLYESTGDEKYMKIPKQIIATLQNYPRSKEGGFLHMVRHDGQLWLDGIYMINVFLAKYGQITEDHSFYYEVTKQISVYTDLLRDEKTGLLYHAYVEGPAAQYFDSATKHSNEFWGRSMGWVMMAAVEVLDIIPENHKDRNEIIKRLKSLSDALLKFQDSETGLWYQVTDRLDLDRNWLESSSTAMYAYGMAKAVHLGALDNSYLAPAIKAYKGMVKHKIFKDEEGLYTVKDICHGTVVGDLNYYLNRPPSDNNLRGLPAVILMSEELKDQPVVIKDITEKDRKRRAIEKKSIQTGRYNVFGFGVIPDGKTVNTHKIQTLVELLHKSGGGTIYFPAGIYLTGSLLLKSGVYIELDQDATIIGSQSANDYPDKLPLFSAKMSKNLGITGYGTIDGNGHFIHKNEERSIDWPKHLIAFYDCQNIKINGVRMRNSPGWLLKLSNCNYVNITGVSTKSHPDISHSGAIDPTSSSQIYISDCHFN